MCVCDSVAIHRHSPVRLESVEVTMRLDKIGVHPYDGVESAEIIEQCPKEDGEQVRVYGGPAGLDEYERSVGLTDPLNKIAVRTSITER